MKLPSMLSYRYPVSRVWSALSVRRSLDLHVLVSKLVFEKSLHQSKPCTAVDAALGVAVCRHVSRVAPLQITDDLFVQKFAEPKQM